MKTEYVLGFLFNGMGSVILLRKKRPEWQKGKLNGVGGHIEPGETPLAAMKREAQEEINVSIDWTPFCVMSGSDFAVHCFKATDARAFASAVGKTDEHIERCHTDTFSQWGAIENLNWLIPLASENAQAEVAYI